jgi:hypothetical protein
VILVLKRAFNAAFIRADDDQFFAGDIKRGEVSVENGSGVEVVYGHIEEALDLSGVKIHGEDAVSPCLYDEIGDQFGGDGNAAGVFAILAGVTEVGHNSGDTSSTGAATGVDHNEQFNEVFVDWGASGLDKEYITAADILVKFDTDFAVGEVADFEVSESDAKVTGDLTGEFGVGTAAEDCQMFVHTGLSPVGAGDRQQIIRVVEGNTGRRACR